MAAVPAGAQEGHTAYSIGGRWTYYRPNDADRGLWNPGVQGKFGLSQGYAVQASADFARYSSAGTDFHETPIQASLLGYFYPESTFSPYLLLGLGWYLRRVEGASARSETLVHPHAGAGVELVSWRGWSLDAGYRFIWSSIWRFSDRGRPFGGAYRDRGSMYVLSANRLF